MCTSIKMKIFLFQTGLRIELIGIQINVNLVTPLLTNSITTVDVVNESPTYLNSLDCYIRMFIMMKNMCSWLLY